MTAPERPVDEDEDAAPGTLSAETLAHAHEDRFSPQEGPVERVCRAICEVTILAMMVMIGTELATRALFNFSYQVNTELGGYALLGITFLSMSVGEARHSYHRVQLVDARLGPRARAVLRLVFNALSWVVVLILTWQFMRLEIQSWNTGEIASTSLLTPLWIPRVLLPLGTLALLWTMSRTVLGDLRRLQALYSGAVAERTAS